MQTLTDLLATKNQYLLGLKNRVGGKKVNTLWEQAKEFCQYLNIKENFIPFVLHCFRIYGKPKVLSLKSWLKDTEIDEKRLAGLIIWKLKENERIGKTIKLSKM